MSTDITAAEDSDVRRRLLEGAARLLSEEGPSALSARKVAAEASTSTMAVYTYFGGMPALVREIVAEGFARLAEHMASGPSYDDPLDALLALATSYRDNARENPYLYQVMFGAASLGGYRLTGEELEVGRYTFLGLADAVRRAMDAGVLRAGDPEDVAAQLWSALHGYVMLELAGFHSAEEGATERILQPMLSNLVSAMRPPAGGSR